MLRISQETPLAAAALFWRHKELILALLPLTSACAINVVQKQTERLCRTQKTSKELVF